MSETKRNVLGEMALQLRDEYVEIWRDALFAPGFTVRYVSRIAILMLHAAVVLCLILAYAVVASR